MNHQRKNPNFYPRSPCGERPSGFLIPLLHRNFYPRSPCGERLSLFCPCWNSLGISIHALLAESDVSFRRDNNIGSIFLSTLSLRRATPKRPKHQTQTQNFYPRSPCGERHAHDFSTLHDIFISIHALLAESDLTISMVPLIPQIFLSTLSLRRATAKVHKTVGHFCAYGTNFMGIASSC